ncbi:WRKY DNA -binding domain [Carpediemonas membranifera]|uniref:WRKY DNA -binding domain n=1 Tax=Carpediemonas membranifera TaxID=201153 RepID=A0A8J6AZG8_9EUKA|nr:WRKY DNA -binding domain [Carpediemonas membranifera]|eukprot:KAG9396080.1 WRKY DNA -binding domain [Carpediemonas membranifera]
MNIPISPQMTSQHVVLSSTFSTMPSGFYPGLSSSSASSSVHHTIPGFEYHNAVVNKPQHTRTRQVSNISAELSSEEFDDASNSKAKGKRGPYYSAEVLADGYHYRKYGQKFSRSSPYPTCYYKCAHPGCPVKRQISRSTDGKIVNTYRGTHSHVPPQVRRVEVTTQEEFLAVVREESKFLGEWDGPELSEDAQATDQSRKLVVVAKGPIEPTEDGLGGWKKYGSKVVKSSTVQKSYYRCAHTGCPAKRLIQRPVESDTNETTVTYQGSHNHVISTKAVEHKTATVKNAAPIVPSAMEAPAVKDEPRMSSLLPGSSPSVPSIQLAGPPGIVVPSGQGMSSALLYSTNLGGIWDTAPTHAEQPEMLGLQLSTLPLIPSISQINTAGMSF